MIKTLPAGSLRTSLPDGRKAIKIPIGTDRGFRKGLTELCSLNGGRTALWHIRNALQNGPARGGYADTMKYFGDELQTKLLLTVAIVEACEVSMPGFGNWLMATGFGNDKTMVKGFVAWAEFTAGRGKVMTGIGDWSKQKATQ